MGLGAMKMGPKAPAKADASSSAKETALREVVSALKDGDDEAAAKALGVAIQVCMTDYGDEEAEEAEED